MKGPQAGPAKDEARALRDREIARIDRVAHVMDSQFALPGTRLRIGLDGIIGLIPGIGDLVTKAPSVWMIVRARQLGARKRTIGRMIRNSGIDLIVGSVPLVGDAFDIAFKANLRNAKLLREELLRDA